MTLYYVYSGTRSERVPGNTLERVPNAFCNAFQNAFGTHFGTRSERVRERVRNAFFVRLFPDSTVAQHVRKLFETFQKLNIGGDKKL